MMTSPEVQRMVVEWNRLKPQIQRLSRPQPLSPKKIAELPEIKFRNLSGEVIPPYAAVITTLAADGVLFGYKPGTWNPSYNSPIVVFNNGNEVQPGDIGRGQTQQPYIGRWSSNELVTYLSGGVNGFRPLRYVSLVPGEWGLQWEVNFGQTGTGLVYSGPSADEWPAEDGRPDFAVDNRYPMFIEPTLGITASAAYGGSTTYIADSGASSGFINSSDFTANEMSFWTPVLGFGPVIKQGVIGWKRPTYDPTIYNVTASATYVFSFDSGEVPTSGYMRMRLENTVGQSSTTGSYQESQVYAFDANNRTPRLSLTATHPWGIMFANTLENHLEIRHEWVGDQDVGNGVEITLESLNVSIIGVNVSGHVNAANGIDVGTGPTGPSTGEELSVQIDDQNPDTGIGGDI